MIMPFSVHAQGTYTAASCNQSDVNAVINGPTHKAVNGDTIQIPAGSCTWASGITITGVGIDITGTGTPKTGGGTVGAGTPNTTLINNASAPFFTFTGLTTGSSTAKVELLNMQPVSGAAANSILAAVSFSGTCTTSSPFCPSLRVDNINFSTGPTWKGILSGGYVVINNIFGVVDHTTTSENSAGAATSPLVQANYASWQGVGDWGDNSFASADTFGTAQTIFIENNQIDGVRGSENDVPPVGTSTGGARYACRFNTWTNMAGTGICSAHGTAWGGRFRGQRQVEVYYNTVGIGSAGCDSINGLNSGTGYYLSNSVSAPGGGCNEFVSLDIARFIQTGAPWGSCNGTSLYDQSPWSTTSQCVDQPGRGVGSLLQGTTPVLQSIGVAGWPNPGLDPVYEAGEKMTAGGIGTPVLVKSDGSSTRVLANRDYYAEVSQSANTSPTSPFNGTTGTGYGTLANRPTCVSPACTVGVGYWATDQGAWNTSGSGSQGQLYVWNGSAWNLQYTPYTYPHPLTTGGTSAGGNPNPPMSLTATVQ